MTFTYDEEVKDGEWTSFEYEATGRALGDALVEVLTDLYFGALIKGGVPRDKVKQCVDTYVYDNDPDELARDYSERLKDYFAKLARERNREAREIVDRGGRE